MRFGLRSFLLAALLALPFTARADVTFYTGWDCRQGEQFSLESGRLVDLTSITYQNPYGSRWIVQSFDNAIRSVRIRDHEIVELFEAPGLDERYGREVIAYAPRRANGCYNLEILAGEVSSLFVYPRGIEPEQYWGQAPYTYVPRYVRPYRRPYYDRPPYRRLYPVPQPRPHHPRRPRRPRH